MNLSIDHHVKAIFWVRHSRVCFLLGPFYPPFVTFYLSQFLVPQLCYPIHVQNLYSSLQLLFVMLLIVQHFAYQYVRHTFTLHYVITAAKRDAQCVQRHKAGQPQG